MSQRGLGTWEESNYQGGCLRKEAFKSLFLTRTLFTSGQYALFFKQLKQMHNICMFDRPHTGCSSQYKTQSLTCISQNDFPLSSIRENFFYHYLLFLFCHSSFSPALRMQLVPNKYLPNRIKYFNILKTTENDTLNINVS